MARLDAWLLPDHTCLAYQPDTRTALLIGSIGGAPTVLGEVQQVEIDRLLDVTSGDELAAEYKWLLERHPRLDGRVAHIDLNKLSFGQNRRFIARSPRDPDPLPVSMLRSDSELEHPICARDADCCGEHLWVMLDVDDERLIWHLDRVCARVVPPTPLRLVRR